MKYKIIVVEGKHTEDGVTYKKGDTFSSAQRLDRLFVNKFEYVGLDSSEEPASSPADEESSEVEDEESSEVEDEDEDEDPAEVPAGTDVTDQFPGEHGLAVYKQGKKTYVYDKEDLGGDPLNEDALTTKKAVKAFIKEYA